MRDTIDHLKEKLLLYYSLILLADRGSPTHEYISVIKSIFDDLSRNSIFYEEFIDFENCERLEEFIPIIENIISSMCLLKPKNKEQAVWIILKYWISNIALEKIDPIMGLELLIKDIYWTYDFHVTAGTYLGDSHGIHYLIGIYWEYDDLKGMYLHSPELVKKDKNYQILKNSVLTEAKEWVDKYSSINQL